MKRLALLLLLSGCALNPFGSQQATPTKLWSPVIVKYGYNVSGAMIVITPHPTVDEVTWIPGLTTTANLIEGKNYSTEVIWTRRVKDDRLLTGVDTIGWVGSRWNPYFGHRVIQVADTNHKVLPTTLSVTVERGTQVRF